MTDPNPTPRIPIRPAQREARGRIARLVVLGDVCVARGFEVRFLEAPLEEVVDPALLSCLRQADAVIANIESVLTDKETWRIPGAGLRADPRLARVLRTMGITHACLANNHLRDLLCPGVLDTIRHCRAAGMEVVGAGSNREEAARPWTGQIGGRHTTLIAVAERELNTAGANHAGAAEFDPEQLPGTIARHRPAAELLLVLVHAGHEFFLSPSPRQVRTYRAAAAAGADAVVGHHPHVLNGWESHGGCPVFYSLGNFCFDSDYVCAWPHWEKGLALCLTVDDLGILEISGIPLEIERARMVRIPRGAAFQRFTEWWDSLNALLTDESRWRTAWRENCMARYESELRTVFQRNATALGEDRPGIAALRWINTFNCPTTREYYSEVFSELARREGLTTE